MFRLSVSCELPRFSGMARHARPRFWGNFALAAPRGGGALLALPRRPLAGPERPRAAGTGGGGPPDARPSPGIAGGMPPMSFGSVTGGGLPAPIIALPIRFARPRMVP